jgi:hypothetical protein
MTVHQWVLRVSERWLPNSGLLPLPEEPFSTVALGLTSSIAFSTSIFDQSTEIFADHRFPLRRCPLVTKGTA